MFVLEDTFQIKQKGKAKTTELLHECRHYSSQTQNKTIPKMKNCDRTVVIVTANESAVKLTERLGKVTSR